MTLLYQGDILPSVTTSQILLRRHRPQAQITADGNFGPLTKSAVVAFQTQNSLSADGIIGQRTWHKFESVSKFQTIDVVDGTDPSLVQLEAADLRQAGFDPIVVYGMSNGVEYVMRSISAKARSGQVMLLRIHGHGNKGLQNVTGGQINGAPHLAGISTSNFGQIQASLATISGIFVKFGSAQLLGCDVGGGSGASLVRQIADTWGVPVTAGTHTQYGGGSATFRFEGPTVTGFPSGGSLKSWSQVMQDTYGNITMPT